jgi:hypothetical protein
MELNTAIHVLADNIWKHGEGKVLCIIPSEYANKQNPASDAVYEELKATHYKLSWEEKAKKVKIVFYSADSFGASLNLGEVVSTRIVKV